MRKLMEFRFCFTDFSPFAGFWSALERLFAILDNHGQCFNCSSRPYECRKLSCGLIPVY